MIKLKGLIRGSFQGSLKGLGFRAPLRGVLKGLGFRVPLGVQGLGFH